MLAEQCENQWGLQPPCAKVIRPHQPYRYSTYYLRHTHKQEVTLLAKNLPDGELRQVHLACEEPQLHPREDLGKGSPSLFLKSI